MGKRFVTEAKINLKRDVNDSRDKLFSKARTLLSEAPEVLPSQKDWTPEMSPVKDQGSLGSCVAFAVCAMKEWQEQKENLLEIEGGKLDYRKKRFYDLSEQWIYYMCKKIDPWPNEEGTSIRYGMKVLQKIGVPVEDGWEYNDKVKGKPESWSSLVARWNTIKSYRRLNGLQEIRTALNLGPCVIGIELFDEFFYVDKTGIVRWPAQSWKSAGGHAICLVGYDDDKELLKFKNSWSTAWGQDGYGYISYNYANKYIWDAWAAEDMSVTKRMLKGAVQLIG